MNGRPRILFVDDEAMILQGLRLALGRQRARWDMEFVDSAAAARERQAAAPFDVLVTDMVMPTMDGVELLGWFRDHAPGTARIVLSGYASEPMMMKAVPLAHYVLCKPCDPELLQLAIDRSLGLSAALSGGFDRALAAVWMAWQPIVRVTDRSLYGCEALLRSSEPTLASPMHLLAAAEHLGRLDHLGAVVRSLAAAAEVPGLRFVNLHPRDLLDAALYDPAAPLSRVAQSVVLEITERASLDAVPDVEGRLARLRALGFRLAVDDLGEGYAGLTTFVRFAPDIAKIDMSLVRGIDGHAIKQRIVASLVQLCRDLGVGVVAEGVETAAERDQLCALGCDYLQGYLFARPARNVPDWTWG
jgi:EAL domain-containing protein (putative c-di-GMP-specific phosphodiesterase class I)